MAAPLRPRLEEIVAELLRRSDASGEVSLDELGEAIGAERVDVEEIDRMMTALEEAGRTVTAPEGGDAPATLRRVLDAARALRRERALRPTLDEIAARAGVEVGMVRRALLFARVLGRS